MYIRLRLLLAVSFALAISSNASAQWVKIDNGLPTNITIGSLITLGSDLFAGDPDRDSGVYRFDKMSLTWSQADTGLPHNESGGDRYILSFDTIGQNLYIGTNAGIFVSADRGDHWTATSSYSQFHQVGAIAHNSSRIFISAGAGTRVIYSSSDNGSNWTPMSMTDFPVQPYVRNLYADDSTLLACIDEAGIFRSTDGGAHWKLTNPAGVSSSSFSAVVTCPFGLLTSGYGGNVYLSTDDGASWSVLFHPPNLWNRYLVLTRNTVFVSLSKSGVSMSANGGANWSAANTGMETASIMSLTVSDGYLYAGTDYSPGTYQSDQGVWRRPLAEFTAASVPTSQEQASPNGELDIYDLLGRSIYHGLETAKPMLPPGYYFERTSESVKKILIP